MDSVCQAFNKINLRFGANRIRVNHVDSGFIEFLMFGAGYFEIRRKGNLEVYLKKVDCDGELRETPMSRWLEAIANDKKRNEKGEMV